MISEPQTSYKSITSSPLANDDDDDLPPKSNAEKPLQPEFVVYRRRWYMLFVVAGISGIQGGYWANFGPIAQSVKPLFGWDNGTIALLNNWGPICYLLAVYPYAWLMDVKGLRAAVVSAWLLVFIGSLARSITADDDFGAALMHLGQILNAIAGPVAMSAATVLSSKWFPPDQRTTATSLISVCNYGGVAGIFVLGPKYVPALGTASGDDDDGPDILTDSERAQTADNLLSFMRWQSAIAGVFTMCCIVYFPEDPPKPPSYTSTVDRIDFRAGMQQLWPNKDFWWVSMSYGVVTGFYGGWGSMLGPNMEAVLPRNQAQVEAGWLGFWGAIAGMVGGVLFGIWADYFHGHMKEMVLVFCGMGSLAFVTFAMTCDSILVEQSKALLYAITILCGFVVNGLVSTNGNNSKHR